MRNIKAKTPRLSGGGARILTRKVSSKRARSLKAAPAFKTILVATDFSEVSLNALQVAKLFAEQFGATVQILTVIEPIPFIAGVESMPLAVTDDRVEKNTRMELARLVARELPPTISSKVEVLWGKPADEILKLARGCNVDLILLGTHGRTGLKHLLLGSTAENVVRRAPCPVLVVPPPERRIKV